MTHPNYDSAEDDDSNEENSALKYEDDHSIPSDVLCNHILYGDVAQHGGVKSEKGDIIPSLISETINNDTADTEHEFNDLNQDVASQDLSMTYDQMFAKQVRRANVLYLGVF